MRAAHAVGANGGMEVLIVGIVAGTAANVEKSAATGGYWRSGHGVRLAEDCRSTQEEKGRQKRFV